jgi:hypothetical protein
MKALFVGGPHHANRSTFAPGSGFTTRCKGRNSVAGIAKNGAAARFFAWQSFGEREAQIGLLQQEPEK